MSNVHALSPAPLCAADRIALELRALVLIGLTGEPVTVPHVTRSMRGRLMKEHEALPSVVVEVLDYEETAALLMTALRDSSCAYVKALRVAIAERVGRTRAAELAELEEQEAGATA